MKLNFNKLFWVLTLGFLFIQPANAYLDPGTGSYVFQVAIAAFAGAGLALKVFWGNIKTFISSKFLRKD